MRYERFVQYTSNWHRVLFSDYHDDMIRWCCEHQSTGAFHVCTEGIPYRKIEDPVHFRFESKKDAVLFALTWCGEKAA